MCIRIIFTICLFLWTEGLPGKKRTIRESHEELKDFWNQQGQSLLEEKLAQQLNTKVAKNVILFLGDGMGTSTVTASRIYKGQKAGKRGEETVLNMDTLPYTGLTKVYNVDRSVPDSAGTATAILCGVKTNRGVLGVDASIQQDECDESVLEAGKITSIIKWSQDAGKSTGIVTNTRVTHATPASGYAHGTRYHEEDRPWLKCKDVARQLIENEEGKKLNVLLGGGRLNWLNKTVEDPLVSGFYGRRSDGRNLIQEWIDQRNSAGQSNKFVMTKAEFAAIDPKNTDYVLGMFATNHMQDELDRVKSNPIQQPSLQEMVEKTLKILERNEKGYFLMVEGGKIDLTHHFNNAKRAMEETIAFDDTLGYVLENIDQSNTLVVVTADHGHPMVINGYPSRGKDILGFNDLVFSPAMDGLPYTTLMYTSGPGYNAHEMDGVGRLDLENVDTTDDDFRQASTIPQFYSTHTGEDISVMALGPMAHLLSGTYEQSYIAHVMGYASCVGQNTKHCKKQKRKKGKGKRKPKRKMH